MPQREIVIESTRGRVIFDWKELFQYRDLFLLLVRKEISAKFRQTLLGPLWFVVQPLLTALTFLFVFTVVANVPTGAVPPALFYLGMIPIWSYFAATLTGVSESLSANAHLMGKVHFPRLIIPLATVGWRLVPLGLQISVFFFFCAVYAVAASAFRSAPGISLLLVPLMVAQIAALALGLGLLISSVTVRLRDLQHLFALLIQLWMYASPVVYPVSAVPDYFRPYYFFNPLAAPFEAIRCAFFGLQFDYPVQLVASALVTFALLAFGLVAFQKVERTFIDSI